MKFKFRFFFTMSLLLAACSAKGATTALPTVVLDKGQPAATKTSNNLISVAGASASGFVVTAQDAQMAFTQSGSLKSVNFKTGDQVKAGDV